MSQGIALQLKPIFSLEMLWNGTVAGRYFAAVARPYNFSRACFMIRLNGYIRPVQVALSLYPYYAEVCQIFGTTFGRRIDFLAEKSMQE